MQNSKQSSEFLDIENTGVLPIIHEEISLQKPKISQILQDSIISSHISLTEKKSDSEIFANRLCSECNEKIKGKFYLCSQCIDYKFILCENCENKGIHGEHIFMKIDNEAQFENSLKLLNNLKQKPLIQNIKKAEIMPSPPTFFQKVKSTIFSSLSTVGTMLKNALRTYPKNMACVIDGKERVVQGQPGDIVFSYWSIVNKTKNFWPDTVYIETKNINGQKEYARIQNVNVGYYGTFDFLIPIQLGNFEGEYVVESHIVDLYGQIIGKKLRTRVIIKKIKKD